LPQWFAACLISEAKSCREKMSTSFPKRMLVLPSSLYSRQIIVAKMHFPPLLPEWFAAFLLITHTYREVEAIYRRAYPSSHCSDDQKPLRETNLSVNLANLPGKAHLHLVTASRILGLQGTFLNAGPTHRLITQGTPVGTNPLRKNRNRKA